jgi:hypothetical protein
MQDTRCLEKACRLMMQGIKFSLAFVTLAAMAVPANAFTGSEVKTFCSAAHTQPGALLCLGYVTGSVDTIKVLQDNRVLPKGICFPANATAEQYMSVVTNYLNAHPEKLQSRGESLIISAMTAAFPCP